VQVKDAPLPEQDQPEPKPIAYDKPAGSVSERSADGRRPDRPSSPLRDGHGDGEDRVLLALRVVAAVRDDRRDRGRFSVRFTHQPLAAPKVGVGIARAEKEAPGAVGVAAILVKMFAKVRSHGTRITERRHIIETAQAGGEDVRVAEKVEIGGWLVGAGRDAGIPCRYQAGAAIGKGIGAE